MSSEVLVEQGGGVLVVTINRPEAKNAINRAVSFGVAEAMDELDARDDLHLGIITGAGGTFCSGMDLKAYLRGERMDVNGRGLAGISVEPPRKPLIAAVEGWALAGGFEIMLACDLIVAADNARFGLPEVKRGLAAAAGGLLRLPRRVPAGVAMEMALSGDPMSAVDAFGYGLVNHLTPSGGALAGAHDLAARISRNGPLALKATKQVLNRAADWTIAEGFVEQRAFLGPVFASDDAKEGAQAFAEKRDPVWTNR